MQRGYRLYFFGGDHPFIDTSQRSAHATATLKGATPRKLDPVSRHCGNPTNNTKHRVTVMSDGLGIESDGVGG